MTALGYAIYINPNITLVTLSYELKVEFWDLHFSQGSYKQLQRNEKTKAKQYSDAFRKFVRREDDECAQVRDYRRYLNSSRRGAPLAALFGMCLSGALSDGAMKVIEKLAMIKYPTPPTEGNPRGTLSYLPARAQWPAVFRKYLNGSLMRHLTLQLSILLLFFMTEPGHSQIIQATVWKLR